MATVSETVAHLTERFTAAGLDTPRLDARILIGHALGLAPSLLFSRGQDEVPADALARIDGFAHRRLAHEPVARIMGEREFYGLRFRVTPDTLDPRADTETLVSAVLDSRDRAGPHPRVLDFGTGTGCLLLAILHGWPDATGLGVDISAAALAVARDNANALGLANRASFVVGNWDEGLSGAFDVIVSNPPYIATREIDDLAPEVRGFDPHGALNGGPDGLACYRAILPAAQRLLSPNGRLYLEIGSTQAEAVSALAGGAGLAIMGRIRDLAGHDRCLVATVA
jgi:release factor glutamine methyltransferase